jgi:hypothetical protein
MVCSPGIHLWFGRPGGFLLDTKLLAASHSIRRRQHSWQSAATTALRSTRLHFHHVIKFAAIVHPGKPIDGLLLLSRHLRSQAHAQAPRQAAAEATIDYSPR